MARLDAILRGSRVHVRASGPVLSHPRPVLGSLKGLLGPSRLTPRKGPPKTSLTSLPVLTSALSQNGFQMDSRNCCCLETPFQQNSQGKADTGSVYRGCMFCPALCSSELLWAALDYSGLLWAALCGSEMLWTALECSSLLWTVFGCSGLLNKKKALYVHPSAPLETIRGLSQACIGPVLGHLAPVLCLSWACLGLFWHRLGPSGRHLELSWHCLGAVLGHLGTLLGHLGAIFEPSWPRLRK